MQLPARLLRRKPDTYKGDYGHILIVAGSLKYSGAAVLCAAAAMRSGAGMVTLGVPRSISNAVIKIKPVEVMLLPLPDTRQGTIACGAEKKIMAYAEKADVMVIGCGLSSDAQAARLVRRVVRKWPKPLVIDADGLNALAGHMQPFVVPAVVTPHAGEMARLCGSSAGKNLAQRKDIAFRCSRHYNCITVFKGHKTVVVDPRGKIFVNTTGNPGMATAGSGDVLAGMIAAFIGQGLGAFEAARSGVYLHGVAGDLAAKEKTQISLIASDMVDAIPRAIRRCS